MLARRRPNLKIIQNCLCAVQRIYYSPDKKADTRQNVPLNFTLGEIGSKYQVFRDSDAKVIPDVHEEENLQPPKTLQEEPEVEIDRFAGLNLERGINGVFEIEDLVEILKRENAEDIFVAAVPLDVKYVDYICIVSGKSYRHLAAIAQFVRRAFKQKRHNYDIVPRLEGEHSREWLALDLGNIALHIFSREARRKYDLDTLWSVGPKYDSECNREDPVVEMLEKHSVYLKGLQPAS